jgi:hypothetical protein
MSGPIGGETVAQILDIDAAAIETLHRDHLKFILY